MSALPRPNPPERPAMSSTPEIRGIDAMLQLADGGQYLPVLCDDWRQAVENARAFALAYRAKAKVKLTLAVEIVIDPFGQGDMVVEHKIAEPKPPRAKAVAWVTEDGGMTVANPNQRAMEIREVSGGRRELRSPTIDN